MKRSARITAIVGIIAAIASMASVAVAVSTPIEDVDLAGATATWDANTAYDYGAGSGAPCTTDTAGFTPADDVSLGGMSDAFDGGLFLNVDGKIFDDPDGDGDHRASLEQLTAGPMRMSRLRVTRIERALQGTPTLRSLVRLSNPTSRDITVPIWWDSALGADDDERTRASSAPLSRRTTPEDDWIVVSDDPESPGDPVLTFAVYGPGDLGVTGRQVVWAPEDDEDTDVGEACIVFRFRATVPAGQSRYLLFFTEVRSTNEKAIATAPRFGNVRLSSPLMEGISGKVARRILNWDF